MKCISGWACLPIVATILFTSELNAQETCSGYQKPPPVPDKFNINEHLAFFKQASGGVNSGGGGPGSSLTNAAFMTAMFSTNGPYDLKNSSTVNASAEFGNWFFGAAAAQMGYTSDEALKAGAVAQVHQDLSSDNIGDYFSDLLAAIRYAEGDNSNDAAQIWGGHSYSLNVYNNDSNRDENSNSCEPDSNGDGDNSGGNAGGGDGSGGIGVGGGWSGVSFIGYGGGGGTGTVTITDLPSEESN